MGKRKAQKTKELSVAIAEASSSAAEAGDEAKSPVVTPRKRGRPRKIVEAKPEAKQEEEQQQQQQRNPIQQAEVAEEEEGGGGGEDKVGDQTKKARTGEVEEQKQGMLQESSSTKRTSSRSRARKKSKPRKSS